MKNNGEKNSIDQALHEKLCAYVLGEGSAVERAEMDALLAQSSDLRGEAARLEATIGLVREALSPPETLSPRAEAALRAAMPRAPAPARSLWMRAPWMRMAAGIGAVGLAFALYREGTSERSRAPDEIVARLDERREQERGDVAAKNQPASADMASRSSFGGEIEDSKRSAVDAARGSVSLQQGGDAPRAYSEVALEGTRAKDSSPTDKLAKAKEADRAAVASPEGENSEAHPDSTGTLRQDVLQVQASTSLPLDALALKESSSLAALSRTASSSSPTAPIAGSSTVFGAPSTEPSISYASTGGGSKLDAAESSSSVRHESGMRKGRPGAPTSGLSSPAGPSTGGASASSSPAAVGGGGGGGASPDSHEQLGGQRQAAVGGTVTPNEKKLEEKLVGFLVNQEAARGAGLAAGTDDFFLGKRNEAVDFDDEVALRISGGDNTYRFSTGDGGSRTWNQLTPVEQDEYLKYRCERILTGCRARPNERPRDMFFRFWGDNPFEVAMLDALSTFSVDVDTASYTLARRYLREGHMPEKAQIRTEEFVNYFKSDVPAPRTGTFGIHTDLAPSRYSKDSQRSMLRVVVSGKAVTKEERKPLKLTFVVDVSGSMKEQNRLEMVKHCMRQLVNQLDGSDSIAIVKFSTDASIVLPMTPCNNRTAIESVIDPLHPEGSTNSNAGLQLGYGIAVSALDPRCVNRVVFLSDGVANVGETDPAKISDGIKPLYEKGVYLNTIGVGMNNHNDVLLEQLADKTEGVCNYIDSPEEAKRALVDNFTGAVQPIARDVKIQVEFDPTQVLRYRLLGYENRAIADADFRNDKVDAGEVNAGHQVTALYELELNVAAGVAAESSKPLATVRVRYKAPRTGPKDAENDSATEITKVVGRVSQTSFEGAGHGYRRALIVAQFAEILRRSIHARGESLDELIAEAQKLVAEAPQDADSKELALLLIQSKELILRSIPACDELCQTIDGLRNREYVYAQSELLQLNKERLEEMRKTNQQMEEQLRELIRLRLQNQGK